MQTILADFCIKDKIIFHTRAKTIDGIKVDMFLIQGILMITALILTKKLGTKQINGQDDG